MRQEQHAASFHWPPHRGPRCGPESRRVGLGMLFRYCAGHWLLQWCTKACACSSFSCPSRPQRVSVGGSKESSHRCRRAPRAGLGVASHSSQLILPIGTRHVFTWMLAGALDRGLTRLQGRRGRLDVKGGFTVPGSGLVLALSFLRYILSMALHILA